MSALKQLLDPVIHEKNLLKKDFAEKLGRHPQLLTNLFNGQSVPHPKRDPELYSELSKWTGVPLTKIIEAAFLDLEFLKRQKPVKMTAAYKACLEKHNLFQTKPNYRIEKIVIALEQDPELIEAVEWLIRGKVSK